MIWSKARALYLRFEHESTPTNNTPINVTRNKSNKTGLFRVGSSFFVSVRGSWACVRLLSTLAGILFQQCVGCTIGKKLSGSEPQLGSSRFTIRFYPQRIRRHGLVFKVSLIHKRWMGHRNREVRQCQLSDQAGHKEYRINL